MTVGTQRQVHRPFECALPADFSERLVRFREASGLTWRSLARILGVSPYRLRQWRKRGVAPSSTTTGLSHTFPDCPYMYQ